MCVTSAMALDLHVIKVRVLDKSLFSTSYRLKPWLRFTQKNFHDNVCESWPGSVDGIKPVFRKSAEFERGLAIDFTLT